MSQIGKAWFLWHHGITHTHTHTLGYKHHQSRTMIFDYLNEDVCVWYFPGKLWDIYVSIHGHIIFCLTFHIQPWRREHISCTHVVYWPVFNIPLFARVHNLQPLAHTPQAWTVHILKYVQIESVECRNTSTIGGAYRLTNTIHFQWNSWSAHGVKIWPKFKIIHLNRILNLETEKLKTFTPPIYTHKIVRFSAMHCNN